MGWLQGGVGQEYGCISAVSRHPDGVWNVSREEGADGVAAYSQRRRDAVKSALFTVAAKAPAEGPPWPGTVAEAKISCGGDSCGSASPSRRLGRFRGRARLSTFDAGSAAACSQIGSHRLAV